MTTRRPPAPPRPRGDTARPARTRTGAPARERRRHGALLGAMVTSIACVGVLFVGPFPVRTWWAQHNRATQIQKQISVLDAANAKLRTKVDELNDRATIEGLARRDYGMVHQGESAYAILPPPVPAAALPAVWPFVQLAPTGGSGASAPTSGAGG